MTRTEAQANLAAKARAFAAAYLIRLDSEPNDPAPVERLFAELCDAAEAYVASEGWRWVG